MGDTVSGGPSSSSPEPTDDEVHFTVLHTNDEHSSLIPHSPAVDHDPEDPTRAEDPTVGGFARLATAIEEVREKKESEDEKTLLLSGGDFLGEAPFGWLAPEGHGAELCLLREIGYDAVTVGNHEYDYGPDVLAGYLSAAGYPEAHEDLPILTANTDPPEDHPLAEQYRRETELFDVGGAIVGVFGVIGESAVSVVSDAGDADFTDAHETARRTAEELREEGADAVVVLSHSGIEDDRELAREVDGIDVIVASHCHTALKEPVVEGGIPIVQTYAYGEYLGVLELAYSQETGEVRVRNDETGTELLRPIDRRYAPDPEIAERVDEYRKKLDALIEEMTGGDFDDVMEVVARSGFELPKEPSKQETPAGNFVTDAMRIGVADEADEPVDVAIQANGDIRGAITPGTTPRADGEISFYDIAGKVGLGYGDDGYAGYPTASVRMTGDELRQLLEVAALLEETMEDVYFLQFSGLRYEYDPRNAVLLTLPVLDTPVPTGRAVEEAELYTGEGTQPSDVEADPDDFVPLERGDDSLYHVATDTYILSFLPSIGEMVPRMGIQPKTAEGEPLDPKEFDEFVVRRDDGTELKVWQTVVEYAASQPEDDDGVPRIPEYYADTTGRIQPVEAFPLRGVVYAALAVPVVLALVLLLLL